MSEKEAGVLPPELVSSDPISNTPPGYATLYPTLSGGDRPQSTNPVIVLGQPQSVINKQQDDLNGVIGQGQTGQQVINYEITYYAPTFQTVTHREWINCCEDCCEDCCENMCLNCCLDCSSIRNQLFGTQMANTRDNNNDKQKNAKNGYQPLLDSAIPLNKCNN